MWILCVALIKIALRVTYITKLFTEKIGFFAHLLPTGATRFFWNFDIELCDGAKAYILAINSMKIDPGWNLR